MAVTVACVISVTVRLWIGYGYIPSVCKLWEPTKANLFKDQIRWRW